MDFPRIPDVVLQSIVGWNPDVASELAKFLHLVGDSGTVEGNACEVAAATLRAMLLSVNRESMREHMYAEAIAAALNPEPLGFDLPSPPP